MSDHNSSQPQVPSPLSPQRLEHILSRQVALYPEISLDELLRVCVLQICRPGQLGEQLTPVLRLRLVENLRKKFQQDFAKDGAARLCHPLANCIRSEAFKVLPTSISARAKSLPTNNPLQIQKRIQEAALKDNWSAEDVNRLATDIYKTQRKGRQGIRRMGLRHDDPLRRVWGFNDRSGIDLPVTDVRHKLLDEFRDVKNDQGQSLADTLREASVFKPETLKSVMGDYWDKGRPVGFVDRRKTIVLIRVNNAADAQSLSFEQNDIVTKLKELPGFEQIKKVRFEISPQAHF